MAYTEEQAAEMIKRTRGVASDRRPVRFVDAKAGTGSTIAQAAPALDAVKSKRKYRNTPSVLDGIRFDSKGEGELYRRYRDAQKVGDVKHFKRQVPFHLPGGVIYRLDFEVVRVDLRFKPIDGEFAEKHEYVDYKGFMTDKSRMKIRMVEAIYGIKIKIVTRADL